MKRRLIVLTALTMLPAGSIYAEQANNEASKPGLLKIGAQVPDFALKDQDGKAWKLSTCKGTKTVVLAIGSVMCECGRDSLKELQAIEDKYGSRGLQVVHLNTEPWQLDWDPGYLSTFAKENKVTFPLLADKDLMVSSQFPMDRMPLLCLVDTKGVLRFMLPGRPNDYVKQVTQQVEKYLPPPPKQKNGTESTSTNEQ